MGIQKSRSGSVAIAPPVEHAYIRPDHQRAAEIWAWLDMFFVRLLLLTWIVSLVQQSKSTWTHTMLRYVYTSRRWIYAGAVLLLAVHRVGNVGVQHPSILKQRLTFGMPQCVTTLVEDLLGFSILVLMLQGTMRVNRAFLTWDWGALKQRITATLFDIAMYVPAIREKTRKEFAKVEVELEESVLGKDWKNVPRTQELPECGLDKTQILEQMRKSAAGEVVWERGLVSGAVYHGGDEHIKLQNEAYSIYSQSNPLHIDVWPAVRKMEAEIISMTARLLDGSSKEGKTSTEESTVVGSLTSGGTESIVLAVRAYVNYYRQRGIDKPEIVACVSAHAALEKACDMMNVTLHLVPMDPKTYKVDVDAVRRAMSVATIMIYASAPTFSQGIIDPIDELSSIALQHGCGLHVDCCLGGFFLPFVNALRTESKTLSEEYCTVSEKEDDASAICAQIEAIPEFDFHVKGVTSMSVDTHKYGYAAKGTSVVLYRNKELRACQYFCYPHWPGGLYATPTIAGSRPGGLVAACYASLVSTGYNGYKEHVNSILQARIQIEKGIANLPQLRVLGKPLAMIVCFGSNTPDLNIYRVNDAMIEKGWSLNALQKPASLHLCVTLRTVPKVDQFLRDLRACVDTLMSETKDKQHTHDDGTAAMYGKAGALPAGPLNAVLTAYMDAKYKA